MGLASLARFEKNGPVPVGVLSRRCGIPSSYLVKVFGRLERKGFLRSVRGRRGGFRLAKPPEQISLLRIVEAIEGPMAARGVCPLTGEVCTGRQNCLVHEGKACLERTLLSLLETSSISSLHVVK